MKVSAVLSFAATVLASPIASQRDTFNIFELWTKSSVPELNDKPLTTFADRIGVWSDADADPISVTTTGSLSSTTLLLRGAIIPTVAGLNVTESLPPFITAPKTVPSTEVVSDGFALTLRNSTADDKLYNVKWPGAGWLAGPVSANATTGQPQGWQIVSKDPDTMIIEIFMPVEVVAKLVAQS